MSYDPPTQAMAQPANSAQGAAKREVKFEGDVKPQMIMDDRSAFRSNAPPFAHDESTGIAEPLATLRSTSLPKYGRRITSTDTVCSSSSWDSASERNLPSSVTTTPHQSWRSRIHAPTSTHSSYEPVPKDHKAAKMYFGDHRPYNPSQVPNIGWEENAPVGQAQQPPAESRVNGSMVSYEFSQPGARVASKEEIRLAVLAASGAWVSCHDTSWSTLHEDPRHTTQLITPSASWTIGDGSSFSADKESVSNLKSVNEQHSNLSEILSDRYPRPEQDVANQANDEVLSIPQFSPNCNNIPYPGQEVPSDSDSLPPREQRTTPVPSVAGPLTSDTCGDADTSGDDDSFSDATEDTDNTFLQAFSAASFDPALLPLLTALEYQILNALVGTRTCSPGQGERSRTYSGGHSSCKLGSGNENSPTEENGKGNKRVFGNGGQRGSGGGDGDDGDKRRKTTKPTGSGNATNIPRIYACPFKKRFTDQDLPDACLRGWPSVHRMKEHIFKHHQFPVYCERCHELFQTSVARTEHARRENPCVKNSQPKPDLTGISREQEKDLRSRKDIQRLSEEQRWKRVYGILFPDAQDIPNPYCDLETVQHGMTAHQQTQFHHFIRRELPSRLSERVFARVSRSLSELSNPSVVEGIIREVINSAVLDACETVFSGILLRGQSTTTDSGYGNQPAHQDDSSSLDMGLGSNLENSPKYATFTQPEISSWRLGMTNSYTQVQGSSNQTHSLLAEHLLPVSGSEASKPPNTFIGSASHQYRDLGESQAYTKDVIPTLEHEKQRIAAPIPSSAEINGPYPAPPHFGAEASFMTSSFLANFELDQTQLDYPQFWADC